MVPSKHKKFQAHCMRSEEKQGGTYVSAFNMFQEKKSQPNQTKVSEAALDSRLRVRKAKTY